MPAPVLQHPHCHHEQDGHRHAGRRIRCRQTPEQGEPGTPTRAAWEEMGALGAKRASLTLSVPSQTLACGQTALSSGAFRDCWKATGVSPLGPSPCGTAGSCVAGGDHRCGGRWAQAGGQRDGHQGAEEVPQNQGEPFPRMGWSGSPASCVDREPPSHFLKWGGQSQKDRIALPPLTPLELASQRWHVSRWLHQPGPLQPVRVSSSAGRMMVHRLGGEHFKRCWKELRGAQPSLWGLEIPEWAPQQIGHVSDRGGATEGLLRCLWDFQGLKLHS